MHGLDWEGITVFGKLGSNRRGGWMCRDWVGVVEQ